MSEPYRVVSALPPGTAFSRYLMVKAAAAGDVYVELALADESRTRRPSTRRWSYKPRPRSAR